jgi:type VI secretion system protein ImpA
VHAASAVPVRPAGAIATTAQASAALAAAAAYLRAHEPSSPAEVLVRQAQMLVGKSFLDVMRILMPEQAAAAAIVIGANRGLRLTFDQLAAVPDEQADAAESWDAPAETPGSGDAEAAGAEAAPEPAFRAATRAEAVALLREVGSHFRRAEPASPIPLLLEKAAGFADRDFLAILKDVLPAGETE